jgi:hypothetical protein
MTPLRDRWRAFWTIILDPLSVALLISTAFLAVGLMFQTDRLILATLTFLVAVFSGLLGGVLGKKWDDLTGERIIVARGKSAIRNLKLLLRSAVALERRVRQYLSQCIEEDKKNSPSSDVVATYLEDVADRCVLLEEGILSSIESWTDITPEGDIKTQIGVISELTSKVDTLTQELIALGSELQETKGKTEKEIEILKAEKRQKEKELSELRQELSGRAINFGLPLSSGSVPWSGAPLLGLSKGDTIYPSNLLGVSSSLPQQTCTACGTQYQNILSSGTDADLCPACRFKMLSQKSQSE